MRVALIQLNAGEDKEKNIDKAVTFVRRAIRARAKWILLPEVFSYRGPIDRRILAEKVAEPVPGESIIPLLQLAREHRVFILAGSIYEKIKGSARCFNTSVLINETGRLSARYRKRHLFKAILRDKEIQESKNFLAGKRLATGRVSDFKVGMTVCYDLRFPGLFVEYARRGCDVLTVPASFTFQTGEAHWEVLLRARAIENLSYILAPNQCGTTPNGVRTYGNSMVIDPWGRILARAATDGEEIIYAELQKETLKTARSALPAVRRQQQIFQRDIYLE